MGGVRLGARFVLAVGLDADSEGPKSALIREVFSARRTDFLSGDLTAKIVAGRTLGTVERAELSIFWRVIVVRQLPASLL